MKGKKKAKGLKDKGKAFRFSLYISTKDIDVLGILESLRFYLTKTKEKKEKNIG